MAERETAYEQKLEGDCLMLKDRIAELETALNAAWKEIDRMAGDVIKRELELSRARERIAAYERGISRASNCFANGEHEQGMRELLAAIPEAEE